MISDKLQQMINQALKEGDATRVSTLKLLSSALHNAEIDNNRQPLTEEQEMEIIQFEAKKRMESIEAYEKGGRPELVQKEKDELEVLREFLPEPLTEQELKTIISEVIDSIGEATMADFGRIMGEVTKETKNKANGSVVAELVKQQLGQRQNDKS